MSGREGVVIMKLRLSLQCAAIAVGGLVATQIPAYAQAITSFDAPGAPGGTVHEFRSQQWRFEHCGCLLLGSMWRLRDLCIKDQLGKPRRISIGIRPANARTSQKSSA